MLRFRMKWFVCLLAVVSLSSHADTPATQPARPEIGQSAPDFTLNSIDGQITQLSKLTENGPVVLIVLRGWPGYQCPACTRQVGSFLTRAEEFAAKDVNVVLVYPGPSEELQKHAEEFITGKTLPANFVLLLDPDYAFTQAYGLRWDAPNETAYPSTFVIDPSDVVRFARTSETHGGRVDADEVLPVIDEISAP